MSLKPSVVAISSDWFEADVLMTSCVWMGREDDLVSMASVGACSSVVSLAVGGAS